MVKSHLRSFGLTHGLIACLAVALLLIVGGCASSSVQYNNQGYASKFGVMSPGQGGEYRVYAETTQIHRHVDPSYAHGFEVLRRDKQRFMGHFEVRFPEPIEVTRDLEKAFTVLDGGRVIRSQSKIYWGLFSAPFWFSENDPIGRYEMTIFIDGELYRTIEYDVVPFGELSGF